MSPKMIETIKEYGEALLIAVVLALFLRSFVVQAFKIPSGSMLETLQIGDHLLVNKFLYGVKIPFTHSYLFDVSDPEHGDIIVFEFPEDPSKDFIKRVIGLPGDVIEIRNKVVYRNGERIVEPYTRFTDKSIFDGHRDNRAPFTVPAGSYFVMGDNRDESYDSRFWGFVKREAIIGKAWVIYWSWEDLGNVRFGRIGRLVE